MVQDIFTAQEIVDECYTPNDYLELVAQKKYSTDHTYDGGYHE